MHREFTNSFGRVALQFRELTFGAKGMPDLEPPEADEIGIHGTLLDRSEEGAPLVTMSFAETPPGAWEQRPPDRNALPFAELVNS